MERLGLKVSRDSKNARRSCTTYCIAVAFVCVTNEMSMSMSFGWLMWSYDNEA